MRYYKIVIRNPKTGALIQPAYFSGIINDATYTSVVNGKTLPGALNIELDIPVAGYALPRQGSLVRIWGVSIQEILHPDLNGADIKIFAGSKRVYRSRNLSRPGLSPKGKSSRRLAIGSASHNRST